MIKKGLSLTLATAAFALVQTGFAMAPMVQDPGDVVVGDAESEAVGDPNNFNYPDAFNLITIATDDSFTTSAQIIWSYYVADTYEINGVPSLPSANISLAVAPAVGDQIQANDNDPGQPAGDTDPFTVTFRNTFLSPQGGPNTDPGPGCPLSSQTRALTLFASDGTTASMQTILVYTCNDTSDSISGAGLELIRDDVFPTNITGWFGAVQAGGGTFGTTIGTLSGLCMNTPAAGANQQGWAFFGGAFGGYVELVDGKVWLARTHAESTAIDATPRQMPLLDMVYDNTTQSFDGVTYAFIEGLTYGGEFVVIDNEGGANGIAPLIPQGRTYFDHYISPIAMQLPQWKGDIDNANSAYATAVDDTNDFNFQFRVLDADPGIIASSRQGTICITRLQMFQGDLAAMRGSETLAFGPAFDTTTHFAVNITGTGGTNTIDNANDWVDMQLTADTSPASNGSAKRIGVFDTTVLGPTPGTAEFNLALYPIDYTADTLYLIASNMESRAAAGVDAQPGLPVDIVNMVAFQPSLDILASVLVLHGATANMENAGSPRHPTSVGGAPQEYVALFYTNNKTLTGSPNGDGFAPQLQFFNNNAAIVGAGTDPFRVNSLEVYDLGQTSPPNN